MYEDELRARMEETAKEPPRQVTLPKWGLCYVRDITVAEMEDQAEDTADRKDKRRLARAACRIICNPEGKPIYNPDDPDDVSLIARQPWKLLSKIIAEGDEGN